MSDEELLKRIKLGMGYLLAHGRIHQCDDILELVSRYAAANAARPPGVATLDTPAGETEGRPVLVGGVQGRTCTPDVARLLAAATGALKMLDWHFGDLGHHPDACGCAVCGTRTNLRAAVAGHEAAQSALAAASPDPDGPIATWYQSRGLKVPPDAGQ